MTPTAQKYLQEYADLLDSVQIEEDVYGRIMSWQWAQWPRRQAEVVADLNNSLGLKGLHQLRPDHLPTTAVGRLNGLVFVSANPGYGAGNGAEQDFRVLNAESNRRFCEQMFEELPSKTRTTAPYWTSALGVARYAFDPSGEPLHGLSRWKAAVKQCWQIGGADLIPFHSSRDGILPNLDRPGFESLRRVALATLAMICRLPGASTSPGVVPRRLVVVASPTGARFVQQMTTEGCLKAQPYLEASAPWDRLRLYQGPNGTRVLTIPNQVLCGGRPAGFRAADFGQRITHLLGGR